MSDFLWGTLVFLLRVSDFALDIARMFDLARGVTGGTKFVEVPPEPKRLPAAAERALAEAEARKRERAAQAASGTFQAS